MIYFNLKRDVQYYYKRLAAQGKEMNLTHLKIAIWIWYITQFLLTYLIIPAVSIYYFGWKVLFIILPYLIIEPIDIKLDIQEEGEKWKNE